MSLSLLERFTAIENILNEECVERDEPIHGAINALVTGQHCFFLGAKGTAKSMIIDRLMARIFDVKYVKLPMSRLLGEDDAFGPVDLAGYEHGVYQRLTAGFLPDAQVIYANEVFEGGPSLLKAWLGLMNEREYRNGGQIVPAELSTMFADSNLMPDDQMLAAFADRLLLRYKIEEIGDSSAFRKMLGTEPDPSPEPLLSWVDVLKAKDEVLGITLDDSVLDALTEVWMALKAQSIMPSGRRYKQALLIVRGEAWLDGRAVATAEHLPILSHVLWERPEQADEVRRVIMDVSNPVQKTFLRLLQDLSTVNKIIDDAVASQKDKRPDAEDIGLEAYRKLKTIVGEYRDAQTKYPDLSRSRKVVGQFKTRGRDTALRIVCDVFGLEASSLKEFGVDLD